MVALSERVTVLRNNAGKLIANVWPFALHRSKEAIKKLFNLQHNKLSTIRCFANRQTPRCSEQTPCCNEVSWY